MAERYLELVFMYQQLLDFAEEVIHEVRYLGRRWWVKPFNREEQRDLYGALNRVFLYFKYNNTEDFYKFVRMTPPQFQYVLELVSDRLTKNSARTPLPPQLRLAATLHFLGHGDHVEALAQTFHIGTSTLYSIIHEVCRQLYEELGAIYLGTPTEDDWIRIADGFQEVADFPNCIGAIDTQQVEIKKPPHSGSYFYNYKDKFTMGFMAVCDIDKRYWWFNIGSYGSLNDMGVFNNCDLRMALEDNLLNIPAGRMLPNSDIFMPFFIVADSGFPFRPYLMQPFARMDNLTPSMRIFNYRVSRARRIIENSFALLKTKWRIFEKPLGFSVEHCEMIIGATAVLHNFLITVELNDPPQNRRYDNIPPVQREEEEENPQLDAIQNLDFLALRNILRLYFVNEGAVNFQYEMIRM